MNQIIKSLSAIMFLGGIPWAILSIPLVFIFMLTPTSLFLIAGYINWLFWGYRFINNQTKVHNLFFWFLSILLSSSNLLTENTEHLTYPSLLELWWTVTFILSVICLLLEGTELIKRKSRTKRSTE